MRKRMRRTLLGCLFVWLFGLAFSAQSAGAQTTAGDEWTLISGSQSLVGDATVYGTLGVPSANNTPGTRALPQSWKDTSGNVWFFGGLGFNLRNDIWKIDTTTLQWTWMGGTKNQNALGTYGTLGTGAASNVPGARQGGATWVDSQGRVWIFGGNGYDSANTTGFLNDLWMYDPSSGVWTWEGGSSTFGANCWTDLGNAVHCSAPGVYGALGTGSTQNIPAGRINAASWVDSQGNFWLFGGKGFDVPDTAMVYYNDLWMFNPSTGVWTWQAGSDNLNNAVCISDPQLLWYLICGYPGIYGTQGIASSGNFPGSHSGSGVWTDPSGNLWFIGGEAFDKNGIANWYSSGDISTLNDLWMFNPSTKQWTWITGSDDETSNLANGVWGTIGIQAPGNSPPFQYLPTIWKDKSGYIWVFGHDLWRFDPSSNQWAWMRAQGYLGQEVSGQQGVPDPENVPNYRYGTINWTDSTGQDLYMYGGCTTLNCQVNEMWEFQEIVNPLPQAPAPAFANPSTSMILSSGTYTGFLQVSIINNLGAGASIYYTTDGSTPTTGSKLYGGEAIPVSSTTTLQAITTNPYYTASPVASITLTFPQPGNSSSQVSISSSANPSSLTEAVTFTATVTGAGGTPTGSVVFSAGNVILDQQPLSGGSAQTTLSSLPLGANSITASYSGDATYAASTSASYSQQIGSAASASSGEWTSLRVAGKGDYSLPDGAGLTDTPAPRGGAARWIDKAGNYWLFGGVLDGSYLNDLMKYSPSSNTWTWISGSSPYAIGNLGSVGTLGVAAPGNSPSGRTGASSWSDSSGDFWLFGGWGYDWQGFLGYYNDVWKYDPTAQQWTWMSGSSTLSGNGAAMGVSANYGTLGVSSTENYPSGRYDTASWSDGDGHLWIFGGEGINSINEETTLQKNPAPLGDFWEYDQSTGAWKWLGGGPLVSTTGAGIYGTLGVPSSNNLPGARSGASTWRDASGDFWMYGGYGNDANGNLGFLTDLWMFNPQNSQWTWVGGANATSASTPLQYKPVYGVQGTAAPANTPGFRQDATTWTDSNGSFWLFGGMGDYGFEYYFNDLWMLNPNTAQWTWVGGPNTYTCTTPPAGYCAAQSGTTGTVGIPSSSNIPASRSGGTGWADANGNLWLFGGLGGPQLGESLNDFWKYEIPTIALQTTATPTFSVPAGSYTSAQTVSIADITSGATIYYTTDGTTPTTKSAVYAGPISVSSTETIQAIAAATGYTQSALATAVYTISQSTSSFTISGTAVTVARGATTSNTSTVTVTPSGGFTGSVALTATVTSKPSGAQYLPTLSFGSTSPVAITGAGAGTAILTISTTAATNTARAYPKHSGVPWYASGGSVLACILLFGIPARRRNWWRMLGMLALIAALASYVSACGGGAVGGSGGGGSNISGTTAGTYTVTVSATSGSITKTGTVNLTVQ